MLICTEHALQLVAESFIMLLRTAWLSHTKPGLLGQVVLCLLI